MFESWKFVSMHNNDNNIPRYSPTNLDMDDNYGYCCVVLIFRRWITARVSPVLFAALFANTPHAIACCAVLFRR